MSGRNSDMLKAGGIWVSPAEVESRLLEHPGVRQAAVVGVPDADGLDKPVAVVVADDGVDEDALVTWCRDGLAHFKAPRQVCSSTTSPRRPRASSSASRCAGMVARDPAAAPATTDVREALEVTS